MVFEQLYSSRWIESKARYAFLLGVTYSIIGVASAMLLFPSDPGLAAIAFTSLLIIPSLNRLFTIEENEAAREEKFNIIELFKDHGDIFRVYLFLFLGILLVFSFYSIVWPEKATGKIFEQQVNILMKPTGGAVSEDAAGQASGAATYRGGSFFAMLLTNNLKVLIFCLIASFVYGSGSIFIITWNASVWGTIFGIVAKNSAAVVGQNPFVYFILTMIAVFPHMILEASSYFIGAISGGIVSKAIVREKPFSKRFTQIIEDGLMMFVIAIVVLFVAVYIEAYITGYFIGWIGLR